MGAHSLGTSAGVEFAGAGGCVGAGAASEAVEFVVAASGALVAGSALAAVFESFDVASSFKPAPFVPAVAVVVEAGALSSIRAACATHALDAPKTSNIPAQIAHDFIPASVPPARTPQAPQRTLGVD